MPYRHQDLSGVDLQALILKTEDRWHGNHMSVLVVKAELCQMMSDLLRLFAQTDEPTPEMRSVASYLSSFHDYIIKQGHGFDWDDAANVSYGMIRDTIGFE